MKKTNRKHSWLYALLVAAVLFVLAACGNGNNQPANDESADNAPATEMMEEEKPAEEPAEEEEQEFVVGTSGDFDREIWEDVGKRLKDQGVNLKTMAFSEFIQPDVALDEGAIDANTYQYTPFLYDTNTSNDLDLVPIAYAQITPLGVWAPKSKPLDSLDDLKDGASVAIGNDPVNIDHDLRAVADLGLIKLTDDTGQLYTQDDIVENPKNLDFKELDTSATTQFADDVDLFVTGASLAGLDGYEPEDALFIEDPAKVPDDFKLVFAVRRDKKDDPLVQKVLKEYQSDATAEAMKRITNGKFVPGWNKDDIEGDNQKAFEHYEDFVKQQEEQKEEEK